MNKIKFIIVSALGLSALPAAQACSMLPPLHAWLMSADSNQDGRISRSEWRKAARQGKKEFIFKFKANRAQFRRLDGNRNGYLEKSEWEKLSEKIDYVRSPCADWEEQMNKLHQQNHN